MQKLDIVVLSCLLIVGSNFGMEESLINSPKMMQIKQLERAIWLHENDQCKEIIKKNPVIVNEVIKILVPFEDRGQPLHIAVKWGNIFTAQLLLQSNVLVNSKMVFTYYTPLHMARSKEMIKLLLGYGAPLDSIDYKGRTPLYHMLFNDGNYGRDVYIDINQRCDLALYLLKSGANINQVIDNQGDSLLHCAVQDNNFTIISFLLHNGIDREYKNLDGKTAFDLGILNWSKRKNALKAFNNKGFFFTSNDVFELLKNNAQQFKEFIDLNGTSSKKVKVENLIADLFMVVNQTKDNQKNKDGIIHYPHKGYCFKYASCEDLEKWVGKEAIDYVKKHLSDRCQMALSFAKNGEFKQLKNIVRVYPYVLSYGKQVAFDLLHYVMMSDNKNIFTYLLNNNPDISGFARSHNCYNTLLHEAVVHKKAYAIELLIKNNSSLTKRNTCSESPIALLHKINDTECINSFNNTFAEKFFSTYSYEPYYQEIKNFFKEDFDVNICDKDGKALLLRAVKSHPEKCSLLLKHGAIVTQEIIDNTSSQELRMKLQKKLMLL
jgi:ankyrin repeat protein